MIYQSTQRNSLIYTQMFRNTSIHPQMPGDLPQSSQLASVYNNNLEKNRYQMRKYFTEQSLKKALSRPSLGSGLGLLVYKPSSQFFHYLNSVSISEKIEKNDDKEEKNTTLQAPSKPAIAPYVAENHGNGASLQSRPAYLPHVPPSQSNFVCEICKRGYPLAKKYAKNQCQTCYKKMKKKQLKEEMPEYNPEIRRQDPHCVSDKKLSPRAVRNWSGRCPTCQREGVKHYARGCCTMCYRKEMKKLKRLRQDAPSIDDSNIQLNGI
jgi:hypothetical protein